MIGYSAAKNGCGRIGPVGVETDDASQKAGLPDDTPVAGSGITYLAWATGDGCGCRL